MLPIWLPVINRFFGEGTRKKETDAEKGNLKSESTESDVLKASGTIESRIIRDKQQISSVCRKLEPIVLVHGGAGNIPDYLVPAKMNCVKKAAIAGFKVLKQGGTSVEAVETAIRVMEDDPIMNAGVGSVLNYDGEVEADACIMVGKTLEAGGVTAVKDVANPISLAKMVMEKSPHALLAGEGATKFAKENHYELEKPGSLVTLAAKEALEAYKKDPEGDLTSEKVEVEEKPERDIWPRTESVGAVAIDRKGNIAVGASSGGWNGKTTGKFNEACSIGGGVYADDDVGGVSLTGYGRYMIRMMLAFQITKEMERKNALKSSQQWLRALYCKFKEPAGAVSITKYGDVGVYFTAQRMPWAYQRKNILHYGVDPDDEKRDITC
ncbi:isoaspartyl peptidase/L-asparaginase-like isoform X2 [Coccinella septempunctata]|uniref:isoaspartyl peptidase/L-asparaginase-like isoform X2 n=1 Tax=Coccinella septempunctata TaxID=41139 RepID=UPI001D05D154|nr:isoaspartyl peptidase/L-asparaginase-like isoform X2 [Coccinella septempunctata]